MLGMLTRFRRLRFAALFALLLASCAPLAAMPAQVPPAATSIPSAASPTPPRATFTPPPTLTPETSPTASPQPTQAAPLRYGEPAGCLSAAQQAGRTSEEMLTYADHLLGLETPLARRKLTHAWNAALRTYLVTGGDVYAFSTASVQNRYTIQEMLNALHVAGFAAWLRLDQLNGEHILAVRLRPGILDSDWGEYVRAYFAGSDARPAGDEEVLPTLKLSPCAWMVAAGLAPDLPAGSLENVRWDPPDFRSAALAYQAPTDAGATAVAHEIGWLDGTSESPALMCGPLSWAITATAGAFPPGYGAWFNAPKSFWLPKPSENGRPWSLFPPETYVVKRFTQPLGSFDFSQYPLETGDLVYTYSGGDGFDHLLVVSERDADGNRFAVTNLVKVKPQLQYSIQRVLLYKEGDPAAGIFRNQWANDRENGRTGDAGFEVFRWAWREKDLSGQPAGYRVHPGDSLPLVAARWRTPPEQIAAANQLDPTAPLQVGQNLLIPPNQP